MSNNSSVERRIQKLPVNCGYNVVASPIGQLTIFFSDLGIHEIFWPDATGNREMQELFSKFDRNSDHPIILRAANQLGEYFAGIRKTFDIPLALRGTPFQNSAWNVLRKIPYGETMCYQEQAIRLGSKEKVRAVGRANGMNPIPILIPCHRVIGKNGSLTGFGGGLATKAFLLALESRRLVST